MLNQKFLRSAALALMTVAPALASAPGAGWPKSDGAADQPKAAFRHLVARPVVRRAAVRSMDAPLLLSTVWPLILDFHRHRRSHFSPELVACIFWEESGFRLVRNPDSAAAGFGQVLPATLRAVNKRFGTSFVPSDLMTSPAASAEASILALELAWEWKQNKRRALHAYAGGEQYDSIVTKWLAAESAMRSGRVGRASLRDLDGPGQRHLLRALRICSQPGFNPLDAFDGSGAP
jgi:hypothetical protein